MYEYDRHCMYNIACSYVFGWDVSHLVVCESGARCSDPGWWFECALEVHCEDT